jgi:hypothetical protein
MSNRQLPWDDRRIRDRISPREIAESDKESANQHEDQVQGGGLKSNEEGEGWVPPGSSDQGSRKKQKKDIKK